MNFTNNAAMNLLNELENALNKSWIIPLESPENMWTATPTYEKLPEYRRNREKYAVISPSMWAWYSVHQTDIDETVLCTTSLSTVLNAWAEDTDNFSVFGFYWTSVGVFGETLIAGKSANPAELAEAVHQTALKYNRK